jgi:PIN domain nuclease of toxin-antitoxin system
LIADGTNEVFFSAASAWEIAIKARLKRIRVPGDVEAFIPQQIAANGFQALPVHVRHALKVRALPDLHRDPFDRMLVAQAMSEDMPLVSGDPQVARYPIQVLW